ncbi:hypothetical protein GCM10018793_24860 [Streptomyces sulfonofaciens]|uniref:Uncharacterized protein n=1 Tax=Streptomyces sulfonofaciens TaxID=68272 RepID=A0A919G421_9ACTN|nr:hypothetical protein [Streptomyces sulfonofaciens]GHH77254.1 hypothetical protein GCM10018793_24860 [Streptomyces sulfonofaciens]
MSDPGPREWPADADGDRGGAAPPPTTGAGGGRSPLSVLALVAPSLSAVVAALFLLAGFGLSSLSGRPYVGEGMTTVGTVAAAVAVGALAGDLAWQLAEAHGRQARRERAARAERDGSGERDGPGAAHSSGTSRA